MNAALSSSAHPGLRRKLPGFSQENTMVTPPHTNEHSPFLPHCTRHRYCTQHRSSVHRALRAFSVLALTLLLLATAIPFAAPAAAEEDQFLTERCFAVANEPGPQDIFFEVDLTTGISTEIGPVIDTSEVEAIAFIPNPVDPLLYGANAGQFGLLQLDIAATGNSVRFIPIGGGFGVGDGTDGPQEFDDVDGMAYDTASGVMYGVQRRPKGETDLLFMIDISTGRVIPNSFFIGGRLRDYAEIESVGGLHDADDIAIDPNSGRMFGVINDDGSSGTLVEIDRASGAVLQSYPTADRTGQIVDDIEGLAFAGTGVLYGSTGENGPDNGDANRLFSIGVDFTINQAIADEVSQFPPNLEDVEALGCLTSLVLPPAIDIEKATNGVDADTPTGPVLPVGNSVIWTYVVQNTGEVALTNVQVTDDQLPAGSVACPQTELAVGESMTCTASGTAAEGQYANIGTVTGNAADTGELVTDSDPSHYLGVTPAIDIEKATNGVDADTPAEAPSIPTGEAVEWTYVVQNTGTVALADVTIDDDIIGPITCAEGEIPTLQPGQSFTCTVTGVAGEGDYANIGTTIGTPVDSNGEPYVDDSGTPIAKPTDSDPSHYMGVFPSIELEKLTNGVDADEPPGIEIVAGEPVTWTYIVVNTGNITLEDVSVYDDQIDEIECPQSTLEPGESMTCTATGIAEEGPYVNMGTAQGKPPLSPYHVTHEDPSHYIGIQPSIDIAKTAQVAWSYVISNTGDEPFNSLSVDGGPDVTVTCPQTTLAPGERITCPAAGPEERYGNDALVTAYAVESETAVTVPVAATPLDTLALSLRANAVEPSLIDPPHFAGGSTLDWTLHITNSSATAVTDLQAMIFSLPGNGTPADCPQNALAAGASVACTLSAPAQNGVRWMVGSASARSAKTGAAVSQNVPGRYRGISPASVGGNVFIDQLERNGADLSPNGIQDAGESSFFHPDLSVELYRFDGTPLGSTGVAEDGTYRFDDLLPDDYYLVVQRPGPATGLIGFPWTAGDAATESVDSDARPAWHPDPNKARTNFLRLESGQEDMRWDFGIAQGHLEGSVWYDENVNGSQETGESGVPGMTVELIDSNGNVVATTTTDANGNYSFGSVDPGEYSVNFVTPPGFTTGPGGAQPIVNVGIYPFSDSIFMPIIGR